MYFLYDLYIRIVVFVEQGGDVLLLIGILVAFMWTLIIERLFYFRLEHQSNVDAFAGYWQQRSEHASWGAHQVRYMLGSQMSDRISHGMSVIAACVALCPLLGLLGTVTGMISVFDSMATQGGNARSMAAGVSMATIPTMAGMVGSLSGLFAMTYLQRKVDYEIEHFENTLSVE